jgi:hypothetical protein
LLYRTDWEAVITGGRGCEGFLVGAGGAFAEAIAG